MIGPENSLHFSNQTEAKLTPITSWSSAFSRSLCSRDVLLGFGFAILTRKTLHELYRCIVDLNVLAQSTEIPPGCIIRKALANAREQVTSCFTFASDWERKWL